MKILRKMSLNKYFKKVCLLAFVLSLSYMGYAQEKSKNTLGFQCGITGETTQVVSQLESFYAAGNFEAIIQKLESYIPAEKVLAVFILEHAEIQKTFEASQEIVVKFEQIKNDSQQVWVCSGCTNIKKISLMELFSPFHSFYMEAKIWASKLQNKPS